MNSKMSPERSTLRGPVLLADGSSCTGGCRIPVVEMSLVVQSIAAEHQCLGPAMANRAGVSSDCTWIGKDPEGHGQARCHNDDRACSDWSCARQSFYKSLKFFHGDRSFGVFYKIPDRMTSEIHATAERLSHGHSRRGVFRRLRKHITRYNKLA